MAIYNNAKYKNIMKKSSANKENKTMMRIDKDLLREISEIKLVKAESYASVVKRLIDKERRVR